MRTYEDPDELDDRTVERLLAGTFRGERADLDAVATFVTQLRSVHVRPALPPVHPELAAIFESGLPTEDGSTVVTDQWTAETPSRKRRMLTTLSTFLATVTGKALLGTAAVAVGVTGAQAGGIVDIPGLPGPTPVIDRPADQGADSDEHGSDGAGVDGTGVDGADISDRATDGEPQEDGRSFGNSVADEARDGTPAADRPDPCGLQDRDPQEDGRSFGADVADDATDGTPAQDRPADCGNAGQDRQPAVPETPADPGAPESDDGVPSVELPDNANDEADERRPEVTGRP